MGNVIEVTDKAGWSKIAARAFRRAICS